MKTLKKLYRLADNKYESPHKAQNVYKYYQ